MAENEKVSIDISLRTKELLDAHKEPNEDIENFLLRMLGMAKDTEESQRRILIIGPPAAGKSTIRRVFFEDVTANELLESPLEPTRGIENYTYNWLDVTAGIADSAGQEIERWLGLDQDIAFGESDSIVFVIDVGQYMKFKDNILEDLLEALNIKKNIAPKAHFNIFLHKVDLIPEEDRKKDLELMKKEINDFLKDHDNKAEMILLKYYFTSIRGELILSLVKSMRAILYPYSNIMRRALIPYSMRL